MKFFIAVFLIFSSLSFTQNTRDLNSLWDEIRKNSNLEFDSSRSEIINATDKYDGHQYLINRLSKNGQRYLYYTVK